MSLNALTLLPPLTDRMLARAGSLPRTMQAPNSAETRSSHPSHSETSADRLVSSAYAVLRRWPIAEYV